MISRDVYVLDRVGITVTTHGAASRLAPFTDALAPALEVPSIGIEIEVRWDDGLGEAPATTGPSFFQGNVQVDTTRDGWVLRTDGAWIAVERGGPVRIRARASGAPDAAGVFTRRALYMALALALREHGLFHVHAGLVRVPDGAWLLVGASGSGKTTTTLALRAAGLEPLADDAVFLASDGRAVPLSRPFHVSARTRAAFPDLPRGAPLPHPDRHAVRVAAPSRDSVEITGLIALLPFAPHTTARAASSTVVAGCLLEQSALAVVDGATRVADQLELLSGLARRVPAIELSPGPDALSRPQHLRETISEALRRA